MGRLMTKQRAAVQALTTSYLRLTPLVGIPTTVFDERTLFRLLRSWFNTVLNISVSDLLVRLVFNPVLFKIRVVKVFFQGSGQRHRGLRCMLAA